MQKFVVYVDHFPVAAGSLKQAHDLVALIDEMGVVRDRSFYLKDYSERREVVFPAMDSRVRIERISGSTVWVDSKADAEALEHSLREPKPAEPQADAPPLVDMSAEEMLDERAKELAEIF